MPSNLYQFTGRLFFARALTEARFALACISSWLSKGISNILLYAASASVSIPSSVYSVARRLCAFTKVGAMATAVPADDSASAYLLMACSQAHMLERKSPSSIGAPADRTKASPYNFAASECLFCTKASLPLSLHVFIFDAFWSRISRPSGSGRDASSLIFSSSSATESSLFSIAALRVSLNSGTI